MNICNDEVRCVRIENIRLGIKNGRSRARSIRQNFSFPIERLVRRIVQVRAQHVSDFKVWRNHERSAGCNPKGQDRHGASLTAPNWKLDDGVLRTVSEMTCGCSVCLALRNSEKRIIPNTDRSASKYVGRTPKYPKGF